MAIRADTLTPEAPLWRLPDVEQALNAASEVWAGEGPGAVLPPLRRANRILQNTGHADWHQQGESLVRAIAEAAYGPTPLTDPLRNALREFEQAIWHAGVPPGAASLPAVAGQLAGWPIAAAHWSAPAEPRAVRNRFERALLPMLQDASAGGEALDALAGCARDLAAADTALDYWGLAETTLRALAGRPLTLSLKRLCAQMNLSLGRQLQGDAGGGEVDPALTRQTLIELAIADAEAPAPANQAVLCDFGMLQPLMVRPVDVPTPTDETPLSRQWRTVGPLAVQQEAGAAFLEQADALLPALPEPAAAFALARHAHRIGLASVARLAAALGAVGDSAGRHGLAPGDAWPKLAANAAQTLHGMLHQFAADTYPEPRPKQVDELAAAREAMLRCKT
ncbi:hypothetical protein [Pandoraea sp.]|uniref:hypothetical protein n=1 Tax=Pandoraea sp. TaxID=1883445 RepID=UPI00120A3267|nr:hypothetical protein [Pandoraea sp.]MDE2288887.1 hypothetical protein [Burkholderiales bacterium]TAL55356.1 MAG: hypothetical protein EPN80_07715 [Pandoraea sp.]TAM17868.1 MAG: hypothetical protein EPN65_09080 [Pandoraea sp.]